jgi:hypothetical protein
VSRPRAADDFATIRARMEELRRERERTAAGRDMRSGDPSADHGGDSSDAERRRRQRIEGWPPPWVPTVFVKKPRR